MRVFVVSDIHVDYEENMDWVQQISKHEYQHDILILAGDVSDDLSRLEIVFTVLSSTFLKVLFVPGNHELWVHRCGTETSFKKFDLVMALAKSCGVSTAPCQHGALSIVPLLSWYDYSFGNPSDSLVAGWMDFRACNWTEDNDQHAVNDYFLESNEKMLTISNKCVISFSHFLPWIDLMPSYIPEAMQYIYPVLGSAKLGAQVERLNPDIHIYGHSHVNRDVTRNGIRYVNNALAYPSESYMSPRVLKCIYESQ